MSAHKRNTGPPDPESTTTAAPIGTEENPFSLTQFLLEDVDRKLAAKNANGKPVLSPCQAQSLAEARNQIASGMLCLKKILQQVKDIGPSSETPSSAACLQPIASSMA